MAGDGVPDAPWCTGDSHWVSIKTHKPIASVAALTAQPLAALPPYGCGVPLAGSERLWQLQVSRHFRRAYRLSSLSLRGGRRPTWQSRSTRLHRGKATGEIATAFPRWPRPRWGLAMTNLGALYGRRRCAETCNCQRRSLTAATDAIGAYRFHCGWCWMPVPSRDCRVALLLAMTHQAGAAGTTVHPIKLVLLIAASRAWLSPPLH